MTYHWVVNVFNKASVGFITSVALLIDPNLLGFNQLAFLNDEAIDS